MRRNVKTGLIAGSIIAAYLLYSYWSENKMKQVGVVLYATEEVVSKGAIVSVLIRRLPQEAFDAAYPIDPDGEPVIGAPKAHRQWHATLTGPVNLVYFEVPENRSYTYRFRVVPKNGVAEARVSERELWIGGYNVDEDGNEIGLDEFGFVRSHVIEGDLIADALVDRSPSGWEYEFGPQDCVTESHVRVCVPSDAELRRRALRMMKTDGPGPEHPWER